MTITSDRYRQIQKYSFTCGIYETMYVRRVLARNTMNGAEKNDENKLNTRKERDRLVFLVDRCLDLFEDLPICDGLVPIQPDRIETRCMKRRREEESIRLGAIRN